MTHPAALSIMAMQIGECTAWHVSPYRRFWLRIRNRFIPWVFWSY